MKKEEEHRVVKEDIEKRKIALSKDEDTAGFLTFSAAALGWGALTLATGGILTVLAGGAALAAGAVAVSNDDGEHPISELINIS